MCFTRILRVVSDDLSVACAWFSGWLWTIERPRFCLRHWHRKLKRIPNLLRGEIEQELQAAAGGNENGSLSDRTDTVSPVSHPVHSVDLPRNCTWQDSGGSNRCLCRCDDWSKQGCLNGTFSPMAKKQPLQVAAVNSLKRAGEIERHLLGLLLGRPNYPGPAPAGNNFAQCPELAPGSVISQVSRWPKQALAPSFRFLPFYRLVLTSHSSGNNLTFNIAFQIVDSRRAAGAAAVADNAAYSGHVREAPRAGRRVQSRPAFRRVGRDPSIFPGRDRLPPRRTQHSHRPGISASGRASDGLCRSLVRGERQHRALHP